MRKVSIVAILLTLVATLAMPFGAFAQEGEQTIVEIAAGNEDFSTLVAAVQAAELVDALSAEGPYTVFAPTNDAFEATLESLGLTAEDLLANQELLTEILLYHVVEGKVMAADVTGLETAPTLQGSDIQIQANEEGVFLNEGIQVVATDIEASNGVIHVIDRVLIPDMAAEEEPGTIVDIAAANEDFSTLVAAVVEAELAEALAGEGPFTVFAPTNEAFEAALEALGITAEDLLADTETLTDILLYHVVEGAVMAEDVVELESATTLQGSDISISVTDEGVMLNDSVMVVATDIEASNGVIHVIDGVLLPPADDMMDDDMSDESMEMGTIVDIAAGNEDFSTLVAAVQAADLVDALSAEGPYTVFAPTNAAFEAAFEALGITAEDLLADTDTLTNILLYHVVDGAVMAEDVVELESATTLQGSDISISVTDEGVMLNDSVMVTVTDIEASNGVIHVIDGVLLPPSE